MNDRRPAPFSPIALDKLIRSAIAAGTHAVHTKHLCHRCREWVDVIWYVNGRVRMCRNCAPQD